MSTETKNIGSNYDGNLGLSDICKKIKEFAAKRFPKCKFSVRKDGWRSIEIALMSGDFDAYKEECESDGRSYNHHHPNSNKALTERCIEVLDTVSEFAESFNYDNSDIMTDYFDVNFYLNVSVGKFNHSYENTSKTVCAKRQQKTATEKKVQEALGAGNWVYKTLVGSTEDYHICERGDNPYPNHYSQPSLVKNKIAKLAAVGIEAERNRYAIRIKNWNTVAEKIASELNERTNKQQKSKTLSAVNLQIVDYSEKAIAVIGDTKSIKDELKAAGGKFNPKLNCGCGWIFSKKKRDAVEQIVMSSKQ